MTDRTSGWPPPEERVWRWITKNPDTGCWEWSGSLTQDGYGRLRIDGKRIMVHRFMYELHVGPIPDGLQIDHLCRVRNCCNPEHLEAVPCRTNLLRGKTFQAKNAGKTHCPNGHEYDRVNSAGSRECGTCRRAQQREFARKKYAREKATRS